MAKVVKKSGVKFDNIFVKDVWKQRRRWSLQMFWMIISMRLLNKSKEDMEASWR